MQEMLEKVWELLGRAVRERDLVKRSEYIDEIEKLGLFRSWEWSAQDDNYLSTSWGKRRAISIAMGLGRSVKGVIIRAKALGLPMGGDGPMAGKKWRPEDIQFMLKHWGKLETHIIADKLGGRSVNSVVMEAVRLGLTKDEIEVLHVDQQPTKM